MTEFKIGDEVVVWPHSGWGPSPGTAPYLRKITRVTAKFVVLDDETKWTLGGRKWGESEWRSARMSPATEKERESMRDTLDEIENGQRKRRAVLTIEAFMASKPSVEALEEIAEICRKHRKTEPPK